MHEIDEALIGAVFEQAGLVGWRATSLVGAAREAGLDLAAVRRRFPGKTAVLMRFGVMADEKALTSVVPGGTPREALFDLVMARFDVLQAHRAGVLALMEAVRFDPGTAMLLYAATLRSMKWLLEAAGVPVEGAVGALRVHGMAAVWAYAVRAWEKDETADLASVMAALDRGLDRAVQAEEMLPGRGRMTTEDDEGVMMTAAEDDAPMGAVTPQEPVLLSGTDVAGLAVVTEGGVGEDGGPAVM